MNADLLSPLLTHFNARAQTFFTGRLCARVSFPKENGVGYLHVFRGGKAQLHEQDGVVSLRDPMLAFYARPCSHWFEPDPDAGADLACATVSFEHRAFNPIALALPEKFHCRLSELGDSEPLLSILFAEAFSERPGRQEILNRLFEVLLIELLRVSVARGAGSTGFLRGLGHPQLAKALAAIHAEPGADWTLETMANAAAMSRSSFAAAFKEQVGDTPGDYLMRWRVSVAQALMHGGVATKLAAERVGYASQPGFIRAFKQVTGLTPKAWQRAGQRRKQ